jgi:hypothetical protein
MRFSLQTLLLSFVLVWSSLAAFGPSGIIVSPILLAVIAYLRAAKSMGDAAKRVSIAASLLLLGLCLVTPPHRAGESARRSQCRSNLQQIVVALHNYHDAYKSFPPAYITDAEGKPMHSWRVLILPFVEQQGLYDQYDFSEPWNGPNNKKLGAVQMTPDVYQCPSDPDVWRSAMTSYVAVVGPHTAWPGNKPRTMADMPGITDRTIVVTEMASSGIHWMEPRDLAVERALRGIDPEGREGMSSWHPSAGGYFDHEAHGLNVAMADGSVQFLHHGFSPETLGALITVADKGPIDFDSEPPTRPQWGHILGLTTFVISFFVLLVRPRGRHRPGP